MQASRAWHGSLAVFCVAIAVRSSLRLLRDSRERRALLESPVLPGLVLVAPCSLLASCWREEQHRLLRAQSRTSRAPLCCLFFFASNAARLAPSNAFLRNPHCVPCFQTARCLHRISPHIPSLAIFTSRPTHVFARSPFSPGARVQWSVLNALPERRADIAHHCELLKSA